MFGLGTQELLVILVIVLILFGANRLPQLARSIGTSMKEFKKGIGEGLHEENTAPPVNGNGAASVETRRCPKCSASVAPDWTHCPRCGTVVTSASGTPPSASS